MKRPKHDIALLAILTIAICLPSLGFAKAEEKIVETYPLENEGKVYLENVSGNITVSNWDKNEIEITATKGREILTMLLFTFVKSTAISGSSQGTTENSVCSDQALYPFITRSSSLPKRR